MRHFSKEFSPKCDGRTFRKEVLLPVAGLLGITLGLVLLFALVVYPGKGMTPVIPPHMDDGEMVDPNPLRLVFMLVAFAGAIVLAETAIRKGEAGSVWPVFWIGYTGGTLLWQSVGECAWHFSVRGDGFLMCFPHLEGASAVFLVLLQLFLNRTRWGLAIRAAACDLRTAGLMGVNVTFLIGLVFFVAGLLAAVGGIFLSVRYSLYPQLGSITTKAFIAAVIGGLGSLPGAVLGSLILGLAEMLTAGFISSQMRDLVVYSLLVIMLLIKPAGFFGRRVLDKI